MPARVFNAVNLADEREILSVGFVAVEPEALEAGTEQVAAQEQLRHNRIDDARPKPDGRVAQVIGQPALLRLKTMSPTSRDTTIAT